MSEWVVIWTIYQPFGATQWEDGDVMVIPLSAVNRIDGPEDDDDDPVYAITADNVERTCIRFRICRTIWQALAVAGWKGAGQWGPE